MGKNKHFHDNALDKKKQQAIKHYKELKKMAKKRWFQATLRAK